MDFNASSFWDVLLWSIMFFIWIAALSIWFRCLFDLFSDHELGGWGKAGWALILVFLWFFGALIYLIVRGKGMKERAMSRIVEAQKAQAAYIQQVAGTGSNPADQIANAKSLLDSGAITPAEFEALKAKALA
jgi:hypothetical protein